MSKFKEDIAREVRDEMLDPSFVRTLLTVNKVLWVKKTSDADYPDFVKNHPNYADGTPSVYTTVTAGIAALKDFDTLVIMPGYWNELGTLTLSGLTGVKIFGCGNGMQWGEGNTCLGDETSSLDVLNITGCKNIEIAGVMFYNSVADKDAINFTGLNYSVHIHDCSFIGDVGGGAVTVYGINAADNSADLYVHHCRFFRCKTAAITNIGQRAVITNNVFIVPANGIGISVINRSTAYNIITDNYFLGANSGDTGISIASGTAGNYLIARNIFANCATTMTGGGTGNETNSVNNYASDASGGALIDPT